MKAIARILVPMTGESGDEAALDAACAVGRPFAVHISAVFFRVDPLSLPMIYTEPYALAPVLDVIEEQERQAAERGKALFSRWSAREGIGGEAGNDGVSANWCETAGNEQQQVAELGRLSDMVAVCADPEASGRAKSLFEAALFDTGRPVLLAPRRPGYGMFGTAVVAWNGSLEAARAMSSALPLLAECRRVEVFTRAERGKSAARGEDAVAFLRDHGIAAELCGPAGPEEDVAGHLMESCRRLEAGLLVMGAYTRGRLRELVFGGVTRYMLDQSSATAIFMHH